MEGQPTSSALAASARAAVPLNRPWEGLLSGLAVNADDQAASLDLTSTQPLTARLTPAFMQPRRGAEPFRPVSIVAVNANSARERTLSPRTALVAKAAASSGASSRPGQLHVSGVRKASMTARPSSAPVTRPSLMPDAAGADSKVSALAAAPAAAPAAAAAPASAITGNEAQRLWRHKWRESESARERRNKELLTHAKVAMDKQTIQAVGMFTAMRDLAAERQNELLLLESELTHLRTQERADGGESAALRAQLSTMEARVDAAAAEADEEERGSLTRHFMQASPNLIPSRSFWVPSDALRFPLNTFDSL